MKKKGVCIFFLNFPVAGNEKKIIINLVQKMIWATAKLYGKEGIVL